MKLTSTSGFLTTVTISLSVSTWAFSFMVNCLSY